MSDKFDTSLSPSEEASFREWKAKHAPRDSGADYDLRGAYKAGIKPDAKSGHWPDTFKKPNHPTFSVESKYADAAPDKAGSWDGETYLPAGTFKLKDLLTVTEADSQGRQTIKREKARK